MAFENISRHFMVISDDQLKGFIFKVSGLTVATVHGSLISLRFPLTSQSVTFNGTGIEICGDLLESPSNLGANESTIVCSSVNNVNRSQTESNWRTSCAAT